MFKALIRELKRANDLKEKELDLKILGPNDFEKNKSLEVEVEKLKSALVVKDLQKDLDHSEEKHKLKDEIISLLKDRPKTTKVEVLPAGSTYVNGSGTSLVTTSSSSYGVR